MSAYYNEHDEFPAQWLRNLIRAGMIPGGDVDTRDIQEVSADDLKGYTQCHFFAGIGIWPGVLRDIGWPDDRPIWTGSCPCQPFSSAGKKEGFDDERHLWPTWNGLIRERGPGIVVGEQVSSQDGLQWLDLVQDDMEEAGYAFGKVDLCAAGNGLEIARTRLGSETLAWLERAIQDCPDPFVEADLRTYWRWFAERVSDAPPHIRQRLYFLGLDNERGIGRGERREGNHTGDDRLLVRSDEPDVRLGDGIVEGLERYAGHGDDSARRSGTAGPTTSPSVSDGLANSSSEGNQRRGISGCRQGDKEIPGPGEKQRPDRGGASGRMGDGEHGRRDEGIAGNDRAAKSEGSQPGTVVDRPGGFDRSNEINRGIGDADWLFCRDAKWRPVEPGSFPLAHGYPKRVGILRAIGNALDWPTARGFVSDVMEIVDGR